MGASFSTVFESDVPPYGTLRADHREILDSREQLDDLAAKAGVTPLGAFERYAPEEMKGFLDEETQAGQPPAEWFPAADGLAAINALWEYLDAHPASFFGQAQAMEDLSDIGDEAEAAQRAGVRFRFAVVM